MIEEYIGWLDDDWNTVLDMSQPIVRCKDCKHWATESRFTGGCTGKKLDPNGFCAWGERREG